MANPDRVSNRAGTTLFLTQKLEEEPPIFNKHKADFDTSHNITHLVAGSDHLVIALASKVLRKVDASRKEKQEAERPGEVDVSKQCGPSGTISGVYIDPTGNHILVTVSRRDQQNSCDTYYLHWKSNKLKQLQKCRDHVITSIAWNPRNSAEASTGQILLGTSKGVVFEAELSPEEKILSPGAEQYWKNVYELSTPMAISGIEFHQVGDRKFFIILTTPTRLYQFVGLVTDLEDRPVLGQIFSNYIRIPERFLEIAGYSKHSCLQTFRPTIQEAPKTYAWLTSAGVHFGQIDPSQSENVTCNMKLFDYEKRPDGSFIVPLSLTSTEFHVLLAYPDSIRAISSLNEQLIMEDPILGSVGNVVGITRDAARGTIWAFSQRGVFRYTVTNESRNVWQILMEQGDFERAKALCHGNPASMDLILAREADFLFDSRKFEESAKLYAQTKVAFEEVALRLIDGKQEAALKTFLLQKLSFLKQEEVVQQVMLIMWLLEIQLNHLGKLKDDGRGHTPEYERRREELRQFLAAERVWRCMAPQKEVVYDLLASHGDSENLIFFARIVKDHQKVIQLSLEKSQYPQALDVLKKFGSPEDFYKFAGPLMRGVPGAFVDLLVHQQNRVSPSRLLPSLLLPEAFNMEHAREVVRYLEHCIFVLDSHETAVHNYLLYLYSSLYPEKLLTYLENQGDSILEVNFDPRYALTVCQEAGHDQACVRLYSIQGLHEEAVDLALKTDIDLAKSMANKPKENESMCKKLWLKIAKHVVQEEKDIGRAMEVLQESGLIKIEDILPFFPDFVTIDQFKDAICASLEDYNRHMHELQEEMEEATGSTERIRKEISKLKNKPFVIKGNEKCENCGVPAMMRAFYAFPCSHFFHQDCLVDQVLPHLHGPSKSKVEDLQRQLASLSVKDDGVASASLKQRDKLKADLDGIIAAECLYCGNYMIDSLDKPFIDEEEYEREAEEWE